MVNKYNELYDEFPDTIQCKIQCGPGWITIIRKVCVACVESECDVKITEAKEKWGTLRIYTNKYYAKCPLGEALDEAVDLSATICELCGNPGETKSFMHGNVTTACPEHAEQLNKYTKAVVAQAVENGTTPEIVTEKRKKIMERIRKIMARRAQRKDRQPPEVI